MATSIIQNTRRRVLVVPLIRVTPSLSLLSYNLPEGIKISTGTCVRIPFRTKIINGVVWADDKTPQRKGTKDILGRWGNLRLTSQQIAIAQWLQIETLTPLNIILRGMVPGDHVEVHRPVKEQPKIKIVECPTGIVRQEVLAKWSQNIEAKTACTLIVVPNQGAAQQWLASLKKLKPLFIVPPRSLIAQQKLRADLQSTKTYITTHAGLLYPLPPVERVIIDLADDEAFFAFDQAPRLDVRRLAVAFTHIHNATLLVLTRWISPTITGAVPDANSTVIGTKPTVTLIDRQNEPIAERGKLPPSYLIEKLQNKRTLWLHSRASEAGRYVCFDCGTPVLCPTCSRPFRVLSRNPLTLKCQVDNLRIEAPSTCLVCKGSKMSTRAPGIQQVARTIADFTGINGIATLERGVVHGDLQNAPHVVATTAIGSYPELTFSAAVILQPDSYLSQTGYRSTEKFFSTLALARAAVKPQGLLYIVTYKPETPAYQYLNNPDGWAKQALEERKTLNYPPSGTLIVLQPRKRITSFAAQPFDENSIPPGVSKVINDTFWLLRTTQNQRQKLLQWLQHVLEPTWEAVVDPPSLPMD